MEKKDIWKRKTKQGISASVVIQSKLSIESGFAMMLTSPFACRSVCQTIRASVMRLNHIAFRLFSCQAE